MRRAAFKGLAMGLPDRFRPMATESTVGWMKPGDSGWVAFDALCIVASDQEGISVEPKLFIDPEAYVFAIQATRLLHVACTNEGFTVRVPNDFRNDDPTHAKGWRTDIDRLLPVIDFGDIA